MLFRIKNGYLKVSVPGRQLLSIYIAFGMCSSSYYYIHATLYAY